MYFEIVYVDGDKEELEVLELLNALYETSLEQNETMKLSTQNTMTLLCTLFPSFCHFKNGRSDVKKRKRSKSSKKDDKETESESNTKKKKKRKKYERKKKGPKRVNAFSLYTKDQFAKYRAENPDVSVQNAFRILGQKWKSLNESEKRPYIERKDELNRLAHEAFEKESTEKNSIKQHLLLKKQQQKKTEEEKDSEMKKKKCKIVASSSIPVIATTTTSAPVPVIPTTSTSVPIPSVDMDYEVVVEEDATGVVSNDTSAVSSTSQVDSETRTPPPPPPPPPTTTTTQISRTDKV